jgi:hypothetical protein
MIPKEQWKQFDRASHFIYAERCRFTRSTVIGDVVISTVGDMRLDDLPAKFKRPNIEEAEEIGYRRFYETMVFSFNGYCDIEKCPCGGIPNINPRELDFEGYQTRDEASRGHEAMCDRWAHGKMPPLDSQAVDGTEGDS